MSKNKTNFLVQGSILAVAGILVRVIGIIYRVPVQNILGQEGTTYYGAAYDVYSLFLLISSMSMPLAVSKIVSMKLAKNQIKNAYRAFIGALVVGFAIGLVVSGVIFYGADFFAEMWGYPSAVYAIKVLAPVLLIMSVLGVLRGFFQGMGTMMPTAISQILEQVANAIVSIVGAMFLFKLGRDAGQSAALGAAGSTLGTLVGAVVAFLFLVIVYMMYVPVLRRQLSRNRMVEPEPYKDLSKELMLTILPVLLSTTVYNFSSILDSGVFGNICSRVFDMAEKEYSALYGIYSGSYKLLTTAPIAIASALSSAIVPSIIRSLTAGDKRTTIKKIESSMRLTMIIAIPAGMGLSVLGGPILKLLFRIEPEYMDYASKLMILSVVTVIVFAMSTISNAVLQGINRMKTPIFNALIGMIIHYIALVLMLIVFKPNLYAVVIGDIIFGLAVCILNAISIYKYIGYKQEIFMTFILPLIASAIMGAITFGVYKISYMVVNINAVACMLAIFVAIVAYALSLLLIHGISEEEVLMLPKGEKIVSLLKRFSLM
ncbi:MAG: polysaccharide biosynthesis protein [Lachnospiraceae bacterium]|nr:polysaccharide biosynthesis protein [Lachnospiraceae bacterium]